MTKRKLMTKRMTWRMKTRRKKRKTRSQLARLAVLHASLFHQPEQQSQLAGRQPRDADDTTSKVPELPKHKHQADGQRNFQALALLELRTIFLSAVQLFTGSASRRH